MNADLLLSLLRPSCKALAPSNELLLLVLVLQCWHQFWRHISVLGNIICRLPGKAVIGGRLNVCTGEKIPR